MSRASAPPTLANLGPGFDVLGIATNLQGDIVQAEFTDNFKGPRLVEIVNKNGLSTDLPFGPENVVVSVAQRVYEAAGSLDIGIELMLKKNMRIGTGLGSSASSSVASALAVNELLENPMEQNDPRMLAAVLYGEHVATNGMPHGDNVLPALLGGFILITDTKELTYQRTEVGKGIHFVVLSPNYSIETGPAREALDKIPYDRQALVRLTIRHLRKHLGEGIRIRSRDFDRVLKEGGNYITIERYLDGSSKVVDGLRTGNADLLGSGSKMDDIVTPVRAESIRGYRDLNDTAIHAGALGYFIGGSGPTTVYIAQSRAGAKRIVEDLQKKCGELKINADLKVTTVNNIGPKYLTK